MLKPDAPIAQFLAVFVIMILIKITISYIQRKHDLKIHTAKTYLIYFSVSFILYLIISNVFSLVIAALFNTTLFGSIYLAYLFYNENNMFKTEITKYNQALSSSAIQQLKAQLNPQFLFNNLNTLDELIEEDPAKASAFLHHFSELYRYSLITSEKKLVPLQDEIQFAKNYFELMAHKYLGYYNLEIENEHQIPHVFVPPFCLQVLVENAIEHNLGRDKTPVFITISISDKITVSNNSIPKKHQKKTGGRALKNLATQFNLLSDKNISIDSSDTHFKVTLPFINSNQDV
ncbi:sensor histidine kinase [Bizionia sp. M204]|uniref:sensor histidine kinase n=1 Tax=Bizionia sp. M204 TaxID=2675331 RepID=UPI0020C0D6D0|nr:histidine kinase [Bizionia sp. M204]